MNAEWSHALAGFAEDLALSDRATSTRKVCRFHLSTLARESPSGPWDLTTSELEAWLRLPQLVEEHAASGARIGADLLRVGVRGETLSVGADCWLVD